MPASPEAIARFRRQLAVYRNRTSALLVTAWAALPAYDEENIEEFTEATATPLVAAKRASVALSAAFYAIALTIPPVGVDPDDIDVLPDLRGPFLATWHALTMGRGIDEAIRVGRSTASATAYDFVQSTSRRTGDLVVARADIDTGWRRVPGAKACDWCRMVATQTYRTAESADFGHQRDDCIAVPA